MKSYVIDGQIELFVDENRNCNNCDVEWCSLKCFFRRGYIRHIGKWVRKEDGTILRMTLSSMECKIDIADFGEIDK